jgi:hypothetical protein
MPKMPEVEELKPNHESTKIGKHEKGLGGK